MTAAELRRVAFKATADRMISLGELCELVAGRVTLVLELKSHFDGDRRLPMRVAELLRGYSGPVAVMSFDPGQIAAIRHAAAPDCGAAWWPNAVIARITRTEAGSASSTDYARRPLEARPQFLAYSVRDLPSPVPLFSRYLLRLPLLTWTVRSEDDRARAARWADQMIFEGFRP